MWFWNSFVAPKLLSGQFRKLPGIPEVESCGLDHAYASSHDKKSSTKSTSSSKFKLGTGIYNVSDVCYLCSEPCKDNFIQCNTCFMSYHKSCVGSDIAFPVISAKIIYFLYIGSYMLQIPQQTRTILSP